MFKSKCKEKLHIYIFMHDGSDHWPHFVVSVYNTPGCWELVLGSPYLPPHLSMTPLGTNPDPFLPLIVIKGNPNPLTNGGS